MKTQRKGRWRPEELKGLARKAEAAGKCVTAAQARRFNRRATLDELEVIDARAVNAACTEWLRRRGILMRSREDFGTMRRIALVGGWE